MILYRAINTDDINSLCKYGSMHSSLTDSCIKSIEKGAEIRKNIYTYTKLCIFDDRKYALDTVIGHVSGEKIKARMSPWLSLSPDFSLVASEYSIPQSGRYNYSRKRKSIAVIDIPDDIIIGDENKLLEIRSSKDKNFVVDLRNDNLSKFFKCEAIMAEKYNENMPGYDFLALLNREQNNIITSVSGFSNFATSVSEMLVFAEIEKKYIKAVISPEVVDIIYAYNINDNDLIIENSKEIEKIINNKNPKYVGYNLVDILYSDYKNIDGSNIEEKYNYLMNQKMMEIGELGSYRDEQFKVSRTLDERIVVKNYDKLNELHKRLKNDLILIEKNNIPYYHDFEKKGFYNDELGEVIPSKDVIDKIYTKKRS